MKRYIDANSIANTIRMTRSQFAGTVVIVEGDTDSRVYRRFFFEERCITVPAMGKANAVGALRMLEGDGVVGVFAVVDADFWRLNGDLPSGPNLMLTDTHDLETMIISSAALDKLVTEFAAKGRVERSGGSFSDLLTAVGVPLGLFRWIASQRQGAVSLKGKRIAFDRFVRVEGATVRVDVMAMIGTVIDDVSGADVRPQELAAAVNRLLRQRSQYDPWQVCRGHDLVDILAFLLRHGFGNARARHLTVEAVDGMLRMSYGYREFSGTALYGAIRDWERRNAPYLVFQPLTPDGT